VHYQALPGGSGGRGGLPIAAVPYDTVPAPTTPWVAPGEYTVKLTANGKTHSQPITVKQDPRVKTSALHMEQVYTLSAAAYREAAGAVAAAAEAQRLRDQVAKARSSASGDMAAALDALDKKIETVAGVGGRGGAASAAGRGTASASQAGEATLNSAAASLSGVMNSLQSADVQPTTVQLKAIAAARAAGSSAMTKWTAIKSVDLPAMNAKLKAAGLGPLAIE
jgi:hypothetical protein